MSVANTTFSIHISPRVTFGDPTLPKGYWAARGTITGDATGGDASVILQMPAGDVYSLEGVTVVRGDQADTECVVQWQPETTRGNGLALTVQLAVELRDTPTAARTSRSPDGAALAGLPLSWAEPGGTTPPTVTAVLTNTNAIVYDFSAWGYQWDVSVKPLGSPRKPI